MTLRHSIKSPIGHVREYYGLSQPDLADYLGTTEAVLAQAETGEHRGRTLPFAASVRFTELVLWRPEAATFQPRPLLPDFPTAPPPPADWPDPPPPPAAAPNSKELDWRRRTCQHQANALAARLAPLERRARQAEHLLALLAALPLPGVGTLPPKAHPRPAHLADTLAYLALKAQAALGPAATTARYLLALRRAALLHEAAALVRAPKGGAGG